MKQKINLRLGLIALVALILTTVGVTKVYYDLFRQQVGRDLRLTAHLLGQSGEFTRGNAPKLQDPEVRITWVDTDGTVLYDDEADAGALPNHADRPEIRQAMDTGEGEIVRTSDTFNMNTFYQMWGVTTPEEAQAKIDEQKAEAVARMKADGVTEPRNLEEQAQVLIGKDIYEKLIKGYTEKQWGRKCTELPAFIIKRLPVRLIFDNNYFNDKYQGIPVGGYNKLIDGLLEGVETKTNVDFFENRSYWEGIADKIVFTGKIDEFYNYQFGKLNYRTVRFETEIIDKPNYQGNAVVNYTEREVPYTRVIEHKHFDMFGAEVYDNPKSVISKEYSTEWKDGMEPYYPVNDDVNSQLYAQYKTLADKEENVIFGGRLAEYKYYDMAPIIEKVIDKYNK